MTDLSLAQYRWLMVTNVVTFFFCWMLHEVIERIFGLSSRIRPTASLDKINRKLTRPLDLYGVYRITGRGSVWLVKGIWAAPLLICLIWLCAKDRGHFFISHLIEMDPDSANDIHLLHFGSSIAAYYVWEISSDRYGRLNWSTLAHHYSTILAALLVLMGEYIPFASWFALWGISAGFPIQFSMAFRFIKSNEYPAFTCKLFVFIFYYYLLCCTANVIGQIYLIVNAFYHDYNVYFLPFVVCLLLFFLYDDYMLLKALRGYGVFEYESLDPLVGQSDVKISVEMHGNKTDDAQSILSTSPSTDPESPSSPTSV